MHSQLSVRRQAASELLKAKLLADEAARRKLDQQEDTKSQLDFQLKYDRDQILASALARHFKEDVEGNKKYFQDHKDFFDELEARHILVSTMGSQDPSKPVPPMSDDEARTRAEEIRKRLAAGEDFAQVAKASSDDPGSATNGGGLGLFGRFRMVPQFEEVAYALKVNEISQPVKTPYGYHIIQVQKRQPNSYENVEDAVARKRLEDLIQSLKNGKEEQFDAAFFGPGDSAPASQPATRPAGKTPPAKSDRR